jgi:predicted RNA-binding protein YlxR (DUF448 family)
VGTVDKPELKQVGASTYACTLCPHFQVEVLKKMTSEQLQKHLDKRLAQHIRQYHADQDVNQAAARTIG